jgi:hypothetical protein
MWAMMWWIQQPQMQINSINTSTENIEK